MKQFRFILFVGLSTLLIIKSSAQDIMVIEKSNKSTIKINIKDVNRVYFLDMDSQSAADTLNHIYEQMHTAGWTTTGNSHQCFGITAYALCADVMGEDHIMASMGSGWFWYDAIYDVKRRYASTNWRSYDLWTAYYTWINTCNRLIAKKEIIDGEEIEVNHVIGQAYAIRAYSYFMLSQLFARTLVGHENEPCVPIYTEPMTSETSGKPRSTNAEVYAQIDDDIDKACDLLIGFSHQYYNRKIIDYAVAQAFKARICMVENRWEEAKNAAHSAIAESGCSIQPVNSFLGLNNSLSGNVIWGVTISADKVGLYAGLFSHMDYEANQYGARAPKCINKELYTKMNSTDSRRSWWVSGIIDSGLLQEKFKFSNSSSFMGDYIYIRVEEMYLTAAEAECRLGDESAAKNDLMAVMSQRDPNYSTSKTGTALGKTTELANETGSLLEEILIQRRIELWGEFGRMFDLKRLKQGFVRTTAMGWPDAALIPNVATQDPESYCNVMTIPQSEFDRNESLDLEKDQNPLGDYPD